MAIPVYDDVAICSAALSEIGEKPINSIADPITDTEAVCARLYPLVIATLLSKHDWNFARPLRELAVDADASARDKQGFAYAHKLPSDLIAGPFAVYAHNDLRRPFHHYINANGYILSDRGVIHVLYRNRPDERHFPPYFTDLAVMAMAARLAKAVTDNTSIAQEKRILAFGPADMDGQGGMFGDAKRLDAQSQPMISLFQNGDPLTATRY